MFEVESKEGLIDSATMAGGAWANDILRGKPHPLDVFFAPKSIAVIGASEAAGSVGRTVLYNLINHPFGGTVFPVNPKRPSVLGIKAHPGIAAVPEKVDLALIATPAPTIPDIVAECVEAGIKGAIILSAGFKESGPAGAALEKSILEHARRGSMRIIGPNCLGLMSPISGLNATFAGAMAQPGTVGFISQSGALCTAVLDWSLRELVGFSAFISVGSMLDVGWGDLIDYLGDDPRTRSIIIYMETIGDARSFLSAAREVALAKPIIVIKSGRTAAAAAAAASHTGALTGSDDILDAAFRRSGVLRVNNIADMFYMAEVLARQPRPRGPRLTILTNAGGPAVLATDALISSGGELAKLSTETAEALGQILPSHWSHGNPVDILGDATPERFAKAADILAKDANSDGLLVVLTPQAMTDPTQTAEKVKPFANLGDRPILASWMGGAGVAAGESILNSAGIPTFPYPDTAARAFQYMWRYSENLRALYETPMPPAGFGERDLDRRTAEEIVDSARRSERTLLTEFESKRILQAYGIPVVETRIARSQEEAVKTARDLGYPVVLKLHSETVTHKTDVGGVQLHLGSAAAVRRAYRAIEAGVREKVGDEGFLGVTVQPMISNGGLEVIIGSALDPQLGPILLFGAGGQLVEVFRDRALGLPPLNTTLALRMMEQTRIFAALKGVRGRKAVDLTALSDLMVRFSRLVVEQSWIREIDINPLRVSADGLLALDARILLHEAGTRGEDLPFPAIRPYPTQYVSEWRMKDGDRVVIRPIRPEDEPLMVKLHETLSERSVYYRYFHHLGLNRRIAHERLVRMCFIDYSREMALVADREDPETGGHEILGVGRLIRIHGTDDAEFAVLVGDAWQGSGLGTELLSRLVHVGREERVRRITGDILPDNIGMKKVCEKLGFKRKYLAGEGIVKADLDL